MDLTAVRISGLMTPEQTIAKEDETSSDCCSYGRQMIQQQEAKTLMDIALRSRQRAVAESFMEGRLYPHRFFVNVSDTFLTKPPRNLLLKDVDTCYGFPQPHGPTASEKGTGI